jgi:hypothetical protein
VGVVGVVYLPCGEAIYRTAVTHLARGEPNFRAA